MHKQAQISLLEENLACQIEASFLKSEEIK